MAHLSTLERERSYQPIPFYRDMDNEKSIKLDLNALCIRRPTDTFFIQVKNPNLMAWGIELNDLLIVEQNTTLAINDLLVLEKDREYKFYQFFNEINGEKILFALDVREPNLRIQDWQEVQLAGVITNVVHQVKSRTAPVRYAA